MNTPATEIVNNDVSSLVKLLNKVFSWFDKKPIEDQYSFSMGVQTITWIALLVVLIILGVKLFHYNKRRKSGIKVKGEGGEMFVSRVALKGFVKTILKQFPEIEVRRIKLIRRNAKSFKLQVFISAPMDRKLTILNDEVSQLVRDGLSQRLDLESISLVQVIVDKFHNKVSDIHHQHTTFLKDDEEELPTVADAEEKKESDGLIF